MIFRRIPVVFFLTLALIAAFFFAVSNGRVAGLWLNTAILALGTALVAMPIGVVLAVTIAKTDAVGRGAAILVLVAMLFVPLYLQAGAWDAGFGLQGWHTLTRDSSKPVEPWMSGWRAVIWVHAMAAVPWVALVVAAGLRLVEPELEEDANLNSGGLSVLVHVTLRRALPWIVVAALWVAIGCSTEIVVTDLFQVRTFAEEVYTQAALGAFDFSAESAERLPATGLWGGILVTTGLGLLVLAIVRCGLIDAGQPPARPRWIWRLGANRWPVTALAWCLLMLVAVVPLGNLAYIAGVEVLTTESGRERSWSAAKAVERVAAAPAELRREIWQTTKLGLAAASVAVILGLPVAWSLRLTRRTPWVRLTFLTICLTLPGPLLGIGVIRLLNHPLDSPMAWMTLLYDESRFGFAAWLVQTIRALPVATFILWPALAAVPQDTLDSATLDGAGRWRQLWRIALPQCWPAVAAAWIVALAVAAGEVAATILVIPPGVTTLSVRLFTLLHYGVEDRLASITLVMMLGSAALTLTAWACVTRFRMGSRSSNL